MPCYHRLELGLLSGGSNGNGSSAVLGDENKKREVDLDTEEEGDHDPVATYKQSLEEEYYSLVNGLALLTKERTMYFGKLVGIPRIPSTRDETRERKVLTVALAAIDEDMERIVRCQNIKQELHHPSLFRAVPLVQNSGPGFALSFTSRSLSFTTVKGKTENNKEFKVLPTTPKTMVYIDTIMLPSSVRDLSATILFSPLRVLLTLVIVADAP